MRNSRSILVLLPALLLTMGFGASNPVFAQSLSVVEEAKLKASDAHMDHYFGSSVALSGDYLIVGTPYDGWYLGQDSGAAYVFERAAGIWIEKKKLVSNNIAGYDIFGRNVAASGDRVAVVDSSDHDLGEWAGAVYVYSRDDGLWNLEEKILASDGTAEDRFGRGGIDLEGDTLVVGAIGETVAGPYSGAAYVFVHDGVSWYEQAKLLASDGAAYDYFGTSVAISGDALAVGAYGDDDLGSSSGAVYVYRRSGDVWTETAKLTAYDGQANDRFGGSVDLSGDRLVAGGPTVLVELPDMAYQSGWLYPFAHDGSSWTPEPLIPVNGFVGDVLEFSESGDKLIVGAPYDPNPGGFNHGSVQVFVRGDGVWTEDQKITVAEGGEYLDLGRSVTISGTTVVAGAPGDMETAFLSGAAYVFLLSGDSDSDSDGEPDVSDNCSADFNPLQGDADGDGLGDVCDPCPATSGTDCVQAGSTASEVGADVGGVVDTADGSVQLEIEPGDLYSDATLSITRSTTAPPAADLILADGSGAGDPLVAYQFEPDGLAFASPVTLTITFDVSGLNHGQRQQIDLYLYVDTDSDGVEDSFEALGAACLVTEDPADTFSAVCTAELEHLSTYSLIAPADTDGDGIPDLFGGMVDRCAGTSMPEGVPTDHLKVNRFALIDIDSIFDTMSSDKSMGPSAYTLDDTAGCSCEQIIDRWELGVGQSRFGCSGSVMRDWVAGVQFR